MEVMEVQQLEVVPEASSPSSSSRRQSLPKDCWSTPSVKAPWTMSRKEQNLLLSGISAWVLLVLMVTHGEGGDGERGRTGTERSPASHENDAGVSYSALLTACHHRSRMSLSNYTNSNAPVFVFTFRIFVFFWGVTSTPLISSGVSVWSLGFLVKCTRAVFSPLNVAPLRDFYASAWSTIFLISVVFETAFSPTTYAE